MLIRLARREEKAALREFGLNYVLYMWSTPGFIPRLSRAGIG